MASDENGPTPPYRDVSPAPIESNGSTSRVPRPKVYFGDGPFTAPSSADGLDDEERAKALEEMEKDNPDTGENETLLGKPENGGEVDEELGRNPVQPDRPRSPLRWLVICLCALLLTSVLIGAFAAYSYRVGPVLLGRRPITMDHVFNGTFSSWSHAVRWVPEAGDGVYAKTNPSGDIELVDLKMNSSRVLLNKGGAQDKNGEIIHWDAWKLSPDMQYILLKTNYKKQWRHSSFGNYYIHSLKTNSTRALVAPSDPPVISYVAWSPSGNSLAYVHASDLYVLPNPSPLTQPIRVTHDGSKTVFNGIPDWVYEEEVFNTDYALWWSPDSRRIAFLRSDETAVDEYTFPVYNPTDDAHTVEPYTDFTTMKYPKPGYANPNVSAMLFDLSQYDAIFPADTTSVHTLALPSTMDIKDRVIQEVVWVGNTSLFVKEVNRAADQGSVMLFNLSAGLEGTVVRTLGGEGGEWADGGWIDPEQRVLPLSTHGLEGYPHTAYLDILPNKKGFNHLCLFTSAQSRRPRFLTDGDWEVTGQNIKVDSQRRVVYFQGAGPGAASTQRYIYSVRLPSATALQALEEEGRDELPFEAPTPMIDGSKPGYWSASFSSQGGYYSLSYEGPEVPWQEMRKTGDARFKILLENNSLLNQTLQEYHMPQIIYSTITIDGVEMNALELRPPNMDDSGRVKYPVLFRVYGGPNAQEITHRFKRDWHHYLATTLRYVVVVVDGRGTGWRGRNFRKVVRGNLGAWEVRDQVEAAKEWVGREYIDLKRVGIWGWSYGGYMTCRTIESDSGVHTLGMAVAPVTDWHFYDSIYTERYMLTPQANAGGYKNSSVHNVQPFGKVDFLLAHGTGDDNVHFANSAHLLDMFTQEGVRGFRFRMFTDSDHSIQQRGAYRELHEYMTAFLVEKWGHGGIKRG
ncbi:dipeptidyl aminopeptidase [Dacryopinax primogenitus]|uniref:Dipeptidyl aminopeptidase n=1 Tax=Dacryopinax primogenitus (strain DJM 731) TaxID=1858805 RepID=M5G6P7_DACPD|nr:dipeptidyl aminopeptidase [Dacryopinax primogenitus]EJU03880.1 dipeptidyl aminopeptidase [Dacryopinax primogenitus]